MECNEHCVGCHSDNHLFTLWINPLSGGHVTWACLQYCKIMQDHMTFTFSKRQGHISCTIHHCLPIKRWCVCHTQLQYCSPGIIRGLQERSNVVLTNQANGKYTSRHLKNFGRSYYSILAFGPRFDEFI